MDSFELNKIIGAVLATCILVLVTSFAAGALFAARMPEKPGFEIAVKETAHGGGADVPDQMLMHQSRAEFGGVDDAEHRLRPPAQRFARQAGHAAVSGAGRRMAGMASGQALTGH